MPAPNRWLGAVLLIIICISVHAQEAEVIKVDVSLVAVNVAVTDEKKRHLEGLKLEDFQVIDEGRPVKIEFFDNQGPASIVFVIDASASMRGEKWKHLKDGLARFLRHSHEENDYTLILFANYPSLVAESVSALELLQSLEKVQITGNTALYDGVMLGMDVIGRLQRRKKALVLLSDGQDNRSRAQLLDVQREAMVQRTTIYTVGIWLNRPHPFPEFPEELDGKEILSQLALSTGGLAKNPRSSKLSRALEEIQTDLHSQYTLSYYALDKTPGWRNVHVKIVSALQPLNVRYQARYLMKGTEGQ